MSAEQPAAVLPVGFRFRPTDEELVRHYLKAKIAGRAHPDLLAIPDVDLSAVEPWDLPARSVIKSDDPEWFFFAHRDRPKYPGKTARSSRSTAAGYWKATGKDRLIRSPGRGGALIGIKKTLVFHRGRAPRGTRTAWIMHEYRTTEPTFESGKNGSFVLYRLFNKHDEETPGSNSQTPSSSSPGNLLQDDDTATTSVTQDTSSPSDSVQLTAEKVNPAQLLTTEADTEHTEAQEAAFLDVLTQLPDLQAEQRSYDVFPTISSPMRPYTDHPFVGDMGEQDFSPYLDSILAEQDLQDMLLNPAYAETDAGNAESCPVAVVTSTDNASHRHGHYELPLPFDPRAEPQNGGAFYSASSGSWTPYPQHFLDSIVEPSRSDMINSNASNAEGGWAAAPSMQQSTVSEFSDPQQGIAARRIRLVSTVERALASQPILNSYSESEDEAESCCSTASSSDNHDEDHVNLGSQTMAGDLMHIRGRGHNIPTQVVSSAEVADKLQHLSFNGDKLKENILENIKLPHGAGLTQRRKQDSAQNAHRGLPQESDRVLAEPSPGKTRRPTGSVARLLWLALLVMAPLLVLVGIWRSLNYWLV